jgi:hypothetical protein
LLIDRVIFEIAAFLGGISIIKTAPFEANLEVSLINYFDVRYDEMDENGDRRFPPTTLRGWSVFSRPSWG